MTEEVNYLRLFNVRGVGPKTIRRFLNVLENENLSFSDVFELCEDEIVSRFGLKRELVSQLLVRDQKLKLQAEDLARRGVRILSINHGEFPPSLKRCGGGEGPPVLFCWGNMQLLRDRTVGFCGSRDASARGLEVAKDCASQLAASGVCVVSGYASGVDLAAHVAALKDGGKTIVVLAEGISHFRVKREARGLLTRDNSLVLSQFPPNSVWRAGHAMDRNTTICGLSHAMILIESKLKGGTFEAGRKALQLGVPLFVAEYSSPDYHFEGNEYFLARGAVPLRKKKSTGRANLIPLFEALGLTKTTALPR